MPWTAGDAKDHVKGLTPHQAAIWAAVANRGLKSCLADGGKQSECEGRAIRQANAMAQRGPETAPQKTESGGLSHIGAALEIKSVDQMQRVISGFAAYHSNRDRVQDIIDPSASVKAVTRLGGNFKTVGVFIGHKTDSLPMGVPLVIEPRAEGLYTETLVKPGPAGDDLLATAAFLQQHGSPLGMSIGYRTHDSKMERGAQGPTRRILDYGLAEYSYAANQAIANESALVVGVKQMGMTYTVEPHGAGWAVMDTDDGDTVGTYDDQDTANAVAAALNAEMAEEQDEGDRPGKVADSDAAVKAVWSTAQVNDLPNSSFLYVEPGEDDDEGKRVPRSKRHFPYKDAEGKIDLPHLRNAIARIPQSNAPGLNKDALQAKAQRLLADAESGGKLTGDESELEPGSAPLTLWTLGGRLQALAADLSERHKAMSFLGEDHKAHAVIPSSQEQVIHETIVQLQNVLDNAAAAEAGTADQARLARARRQLDLLAV